MKPGHAEHRQSKQDIYHEQSSGDQEQSRQRSIFSEDSEGNSIHSESEILKSGFSDRGSLDQSLPVRREPGRPGGDLLRQSSSGLKMLQRVKVINQSSKNVLFRTESTHSLNKLGFQNKIVSNPETPFQTRSPNRYSQNDTLDNYAPLSMSGQLAQSPQKALNNTGDLRDSLNMQVSGNTSYGSFKRAGSLRTSMSQKKFEHNRQEEEEMAEKMRVEINKNYDPRKKYYDPVIYRHLDNQLIHEFHGKKGENQKARKSFDSKGKRSVKPQTKKVKAKRGLRTKKMESKSKPYSRRMSRKDDRPVFPSSVRRSADSSTLKFKVNPMKTPQKEKKNLNFVDSNRQSMKMETLAFPDNSDFLKKSREFNLNEINKKILFDYREQENSSSKKVIHEQIQHEHRQREQVMKNLDIPYDRDPVGTPIETIKNSLRFGPPPTGLKFQVDSNRSSNSKNSRGATIEVPQVLENQLLSGSKSSPTPHFGNSEAKYHHRDNKFVHESEVLPNSVDPQTEESLLINENEEASFEKQKTQISPKGGTASPQKNGQETKEKSDSENDKQASDFSSETKRSVVTFHQNNDSINRMGSLRRVQKNLIIEDNLSFPQKTPEATFKKKLNSPIMSTKCSISNKIDLKKLETLTSKEVPESENRVIGGTPFSGIEEHSESDVTVSNYENKGYSINSPENSQDEPEEFGDTAPDSDKIDNSRLQEISIEGDKPNIFQNSEVENRPFTAKDVSINDESSDEEEESSEMEDVDQEPSEEEEGVPGQVESGHPAKSESKGVIKKHNAHNFTLGESAQVNFIVNSLAENKSVASNKNEKIPEFGEPEETASDGEEVVFSRRGVCEDESSILVHRRNLKGTI